MTPRSRQDAIIRLLRRSGTSTVRALADQVGVSRRTVLRDIGALRDDGYVIDADVGRGGGLRLDARSIQTGTRLSVPEVLALLISVATMRAAGSLPFADLADAGLAKLEKALPRDKLAGLRACLDRLHIASLSPLQDVSHIGPVNADVLDVVETGFLERRLIRIDYQDAKGCVSQRRVEPQALLILPPIWYLVGWDGGRQDFRHFRMDRIGVCEWVRDSHFRHRHVPFADDICPYNALVG